MTKIHVPEKEIQRSILDYLGKRGVFHWRNNSGAHVSEYKGKKRFVRYGTLGSPDIIAIISGFFVGIECKAEGGKQSDDQKEFERNVLAAGGVYLLVNSFDEAVEVVEHCITILKIKGRGIYEKPLRKGGK